MVVKLVELRKSDVCLVSGFYKLYRSLKYRLKNVGVPDANSANGKLKRPIISKVNMRPSAVLDARDMTSTFGALNQRS